MLWDSHSRVQLSKITALTFDKHSQAVGRRTKVPQLVCKGKPCDLYQPEAVHCRRLSGGSGTDIDWKCEADLPDALRFGKVEVSCEGWSGPGDPFVVKGSCSLEYRLVEVPGALRGSRSKAGWTSEDLFSTLFTIIWIAVVFYIAYTFILNFFTTRNNSRQPGSQYSSRPSRPGGGGGGSGGDTYRGNFPGGYDEPPPPYTDDRQKRNESAEGWRPGFWSGAALGGLATHLFNRNSSQPQAQPDRAAPYDWERERSFQIPFVSRPLRRAAPSQPARNDDDRGEGSSNLGSMRRSTGYGGTNVR
ncbi:hypothetical protein F5887DRAFT_553632 [Amanita rubescens]|nr:hypothetical protein F5887DRAFT_553632 [Amanita rubescens]